MSPAISKGLGGAFREFSALAIGENAEAQSTLGAMYRIGYGVPKDLSQALSWYRKAAEQGDVKAQYQVGYSYAYGEGVPIDLVIAYMWRNLAAAQGDESAKKARDELESSMTPDQIAKAQKLSREWKSKKSIPV